MTIILSIVRKVFVTFERLCNFLMFHSRFLTPSYTRRIVLYTKISLYSHIVHRADECILCNGVIYERRTLIRRAISGNHLVFPGRRAVTISLRGSALATRTWGLDGRISCCGSRRRARIIRGRLLLRSGRARRIADATDRLQEDIAWRNRFGENGELDIVHRAWICEALI